MFFPQATSESIITVARKSESSFFIVLFLLNLFAHRCNFSLCLQLSIIIIRFLYILCLFILLFLTLRRTICMKCKKAGRRIWKNHPNTASRFFCSQLAKDLLRSSHLAIHVQALHLLILHQMLQIAIDRLIRKACPFGDLVCGHIIALT